MLITVVCPALVPDASATHNRILSTSEKSEMIFLFYQITAHHQLREEVIGFEFGMLK